jgi:hypothetical protein
VLEAKLPMLGDCMQRGLQRQAVEKKGAATPVRVEFTFSVE